MQTQTTKIQDFTVNNKYQRKWWVVDVADMPVGRVAAYIATVLRGKNKVYFSPHVDCGDYVVVVNAAKIKLTGQKWKDKVYYRHTGFPGGIKAENASQKLEKNPEEVLYMAVKRMMPKNTLNRNSLNKLKVFAGEEHSHQANKPEVLQVPRVKHYVKN